MGGKCGIVRNNDDDDDDRISLPLKKKILECDVTQLNGCVCAATSNLKVHKTKISFFSRWKEKIVISDLPLVQNEVIRMRLKTSFVLYDVVYVRSMYERCVYCVRTKREEEKKGAAITDALISLISHFKFLASTRDSVRFKFLFVIFGFHFKC